MTSTAKPKPASEKTPGRKRGRRPQITPEQILTVARSIPAHQLTMPRIAARLNVQTPALYYHFKSRDALLAELGLRLLEDFPDHPADAKNWRSWLCETGIALHQFLLANPTVLAVQDWEQMQRMTLPWLESGLATLEGAGFGESEAIKMLHIMASLVYMHARGNFEVRTSDDDLTQRAWNSALARIAPDAKRTRRALTALAGSDPVSIFESTLTWLIDNLPEPR